MSGLDTTIKRPIELCLDVEAGGNNL